MADSVQVVFKCSQQFKDAIEEFATTKKQHNSTVMKEAIALHIGYDLSNEPKLGRPSKYATAEERKEAARIAKRKRAAEVSRIMKAVAAGVRVEDIEALQASLEKKNEK